MKSWNILGAIIFFSVLCNQTGAQTIHIKQTKKGYVFVDYHGKRLSKMTFDDVQDFRGRDSYAAVKLEGKWGYINSAMEMVIEPQFDDANSFWMQETIVKKGTHHYLIDRLGNIITSPYDSLIQYNREYVAIKNGKYGLINANDSVLLDIAFENVGGKTKENGFIVKKDGVWGYFNDGAFAPAEGEIIFSRVDTPAVFSEKCIEETTNWRKKHCSDKETLIHVYRNVRYPQEAKREEIEGMVVIRFIINKKGEVENPVIVRDIGGGCGAEALRVVKETTNKWARPAYLEGKPVNISFSLPIKFRLD